MDKYTGKRLDGRYEIQELIGVGGMAMVYKAYDNVDDKTVAIKILKDEFLGNDEFIRRFKNESKAIAVLSHPNIVKVYDVSFGDRIQYIVMEYIDGITLKEYIGQQKEIPWKEAVHFTVQILQALQHAHEKGIVHRDVKPQNIMLLQDGTIKVTDFGIARFSNKETRTMTDKAIGSVHYIAPEQARGGVTDGKADIYSVGVMLYEMLTGKLPFEADSAVSVAIMQLQNEPTPPREINKAIPGGLEEITLKAMRKDPKQRYSSASEMLEAIEIFRNDPAVRFNYNYFVDETPTRYVDSLENVRAAKPEPVVENDYSEPDYEMAASRSKTVVKWITICVSLLVVAAIVVFIVILFQNQAKRSAKADVDVPDFVGKTLEEFNTEKKDNKYKFKFDFQPQYDSSKPQNIILGQDPAPNGKKIKETGNITLYVNSESVQMTVPKVKNYLENEAIEKIKNNNLVCDPRENVQRIYSNEVAKGYVIDCSPQEGTEQFVTTPITLIVSAGPAPGMVDIPDVAGSSAEEAKTNLEGLHFKTKKVTVASDKEAGTVIGTDPLAGNRVTEGWLVTIQVSDGSKLVRGYKFDFGKVLPTNEGAKVRYTAIINGANGKNTTLFDERLIPSEGWKYEHTFLPEEATNNKVKITLKIDNVQFGVIELDLKEGTESVKLSNYTPKRLADPLGVPKDEAAATLQDYLSSLPSSDYTDVNYRTIEKIVERYARTEKDPETKKNKNVGLIYEATSQDAIKELLEKAKAEIDDFLRRSQQSSKPEESSGNQTSSEPTSELEEMRSRAIDEIIKHAEAHYYTDENWDVIEEIVDRYSKRINASEDEDEIIALDLEAQREIDKVPVLERESSSGD